MFSPPCFFRCRIIHRVLSNRDLAYMTTAPSISHLDHIVLTVRDIETTCAFYHTIMGMQIVVFKDGTRFALQFGNQKINLHQAGNEFEPKAAQPTCGSADLCFITDTPISDVIAYLQANHIVILEGPVHRSGATGTILSVYFRDPDNNLIEVANYV